MDGVVPKRKRKRKRKIGIYVSERESRLGMEELAVAGDARLTFRNDSLNIRQVVLPLMSIFEDGSALPARWPNSAAAACRRGGDLAGMGECWRVGEIAEFCKSGSADSDGFGCLRPI